jgi:hypothetical protein
MELITKITEKKGKNKKERIMREKRRKENKEEIKKR